jgi:hypothetical protein
MSGEASEVSRDRRTRRREGRRLGIRDSGHQPRPVEIVRPPSSSEFDALAVAEHWCDALVRGDLDTLVSWYAPHGVVHIQGSVLAEPVDIGRAWAQSGVLGLQPSTVTLQESTETPGDEFDVIVRWVGSGRHGVDIESRIRVKQGDIVEQWHGEVMRFVPVVGPALEVSFAGDVSTAERDEVVAAMWRVIERVESSVHQAGVRFERLGDPAVSAPLRVQARLSLNGRPLHVRASGTTVGDVVASMEARFRRQLEEHADRVKALRNRGTASPAGQWRHADRPDPWPPTSQLMDEERLVIVRRTWAPGPEHVDEAVDDLDALDLEVLLFEELTTGEPAVVWRRDDGGYWLRCASGGDPLPTMEPTPFADIDVEAHPFPTMDLESARTELALGVPWVAFRDSSDGEVAVLYRRIDGHDGLVVVGDPATVS